MRIAPLAIGAVLALASSAALAQPPGAPPASPASAPAHYSVDTTDIGALLDDPAAKAILIKYIPQMATSDQIDMARGMTLKDVQQYSPDTITDAVLARMNAEFQALPPKR